MTLFGNLMVGVSQNEQYSVLHVCWNSEETEYKDKNSSKAWKPIIMYHCCIHRRNYSSWTYLRCCLIKAWIQLRCLEGVGEWWWLCSVTFTDFSW
jgi:hypothetical protein